MEYIPIDATKMPYRISVRLAGETFTMLFNYNSEFDYFTVDLMKGSVVLAVGEPLIYGVALFTAYRSVEFPKVALIPFNASTLSSGVSIENPRVSIENLSKTIFLYVVTRQDMYAILET